MSTKSNKVELYVSQLMEDLRNGLSWFKKDDQGYGSIQETYNASDKEVMAIKNHPKLKDVDPTFRLFVVIDDTKEDFKKERKKEEVPVVTAEETFEVAQSVAAPSQDMADFLSL